MKHRLRIGLKGLGLVIILGFVFSLGLTIKPAIAAGSTSYQQLVYRGTTSLSGYASGTTAPNTAGLPAVQRYIHRSPHTGKTPASVSNLPHTTPRAIKPASASPFTGFDGMNNNDQNSGGSGIYQNSQIPDEPPDMALCTNGKTVVQAVNTALAVYDTNGTMLTSGAIPLNQFFNLLPQVTRSGNTITSYGQFLSDPRCYYDASVQRYFIEIWGTATDPNTGALQAPSTIYIATSVSDNPTGQYNLFSFDTTDDGSNNTPTHPGCPCLPDYVMIGTDAYGFYAVADEFSIDGPEYNGSQIYAISKTALMTGTPATVVMKENIEAAGVPAFVLYPAQVAPGSKFDTTNNGVEYFMESLNPADTSTIDSRLALFALTNTKSLAEQAPAVTLSPERVINGLPTVEPTIPAEQKDGAGLALDPGYDDITQPTLVNGALFTAATTLIAGPKGPLTGIAQYSVNVSVNKSGVFSAKYSKGSYIASAAGLSLLYPIIGMNKHGSGVIGFSMVGPDTYPSVGYVTFNRGLIGKNIVPVATGVAAYTSNDSGIARWGDYSAAEATPGGGIFFAVEYVPSTAVKPNTASENWGTFITHFGK